MRGTPAGVRVWMQDDLPSPPSILAGVQYLVADSAYPGKRSADPQAARLEAVVRGYLTGSGWKEYKENGTVSGITLPPGLKNGSRLPSPMFTPTTKAEQGHDLAITLDEARKMFGEKEIAYIGEKAIMLYQFAHDYLLEKGMVLADTKFEFGKIGDKIILIDEMVTPDSSRYWLKKEYDEGVLASMDKQFLRDYLEKSGWDKEPPAPKLPDEIVKKTSERYTDAYEMVTGEKI